VKTIQATKKEVVPEAVTKVETDGRKRLDRQLDRMMEKQRSRSRSRSQSPTTQALIRAAGES
jgi:hypothetical protein